MKIRIQKDDDRLGVKAGEIYEAKRYKYDPYEKLELLGRVPDGYDPRCTQYLDSVDHMIKGSWHKIVNATYVPI